MGTCYKHLTAEDRDRIQRGLHVGQSRRAIAQELGCRPSTVSREVWRGRGGERYDAVTAGAEARKRRRGRRRKLGEGSVLLGEVRRGLLQGWSPAQIAGRLKRMHLDEPAERVSHETIYAYIYAEPRGELRQTLIRALRQSHKKRLPRSRGQDRRGRLHEMVSIHERPIEVMGRQVPGHWEGDLIKGAGNRSAVGTLVERTARFTLLAKMEGTDADAALEGFSRRLATLPASVRKTLTYDQGKEMAHHQTLERRLKIRVYFADPHSPWQRPTNENTNGLIRQYLPKGLDLSGLSQRRLTQIATALNTRPRKCLDFRTPQEVMTEQIKNLQSHVALQT
jgi:transposase, IS30 family